MPDRERLSLPLCIQVFPIEIGAGSPNRSDKARREAENISALKLPSQRTNRNEVGVYIQEPRKQRLLVEFCNQWFRVGERDRLLGVEMVNHRVSLRGHLSCSSREPNRRPNESDDNAEDTKSPPAAPAPREARPPRR